MKKLKAQQITEFMLAIPLLIIFFAVLTEFAFAINSQLILTNTLKSSVSAYGYKMSEISREYSYPTGEEVKLHVVDNLVKMGFDESEVEVDFIRVDGTPVVIAKYTYKPGFTFSFLPALRTIKMSAVTVFPQTNRAFSGYERGINPEVSDFNSKTSAEYQPRCEKCYIDVCSKYDFRKEIDKDGNENDVQYCALWEKENLDDWWCVNSPTLSCPGTVCRGVDCP